MHMPESDTGRLDVYVVCVTHCGCDLVQAGRSELPVCWVQCILLCCTACGCDLQLVLPPWHNLEGHSLLHHLQGGGWREGGG
jgi:hypothetical protein